MPFFVPSAQSQEHAESIYQAIAGNVDAPVGDERIETLTWEHEGQQVVAKVVINSHSVLAQKMKLFSPFLIAAMFIRSAHLTVVPSVLTR